MFKTILAITLAFIVGFAAAGMYSNVHSEKNLQLPENNDEGGYEIGPTDYFNTLFSNDNKEIASPGDKVAESQIFVGKDKVTLDIQNAHWATFTDTNSMDPIIDEGANAIEVTPKSEDDLEVGDIVAYESEYADGLIIHRIVHIGNDEEGTYYVLKGDNNPTSDPGRIRFGQIKSIVVAIIY
jgi:hypothetical protein